MLEFLPQLLVWCYKRNRLSNGYIRKLFQWKFKLVSGQLANPPLYRPSLTRHFKLRVRRLGISENVTLHSLRHSFLEPPGPESLAIVVSRCRSGSGIAVTLESEHEGSEMGECHSRTRPGRDIGSPQKDVFPNTSMILQCNGSQLASDNNPCYLVRYSI